MCKGAVARIIDFSAVDGPGNRMVVFLQGCNFNCWYCHNPETIPMPWGEAEKTSKTVVFDEMSVEDILKRYQRAEPFISGVTFSGGECTVQFDFLIQVCVALKKAGAHILIDTNGNLGEEKLEKLLALTDGILLDVKAVDGERHKALTGAGNTGVLNAFYTALRGGKLAEVRTVILGDDPEFLNTVAWVSRELAAINPRIPYRIIRYRVHGVRKEMLPLLKPPSEALMEECRAAAEAAGLKRIVMV